ncbi:hypothetical protein [Vibrio splendidus]|uniref:hypothetical protein n=1 Tax=Vibrio splendidus TaxID=29497 RepID=UPI003D0CF1CA
MESELVSLKAVLPTAAPNMPTKERDCHAGCRLLVVKGLASPSKSISTLFLTASPKKLTLFEPHCVAFVRPQVNKLNYHYLLLVYGN